MRRLRLWIVCIVPLMLFAGFQLAAKHLGGTHISQWNPKSSCTFYYYDYWPEYDGRAKRITSMYLEGATFDQVDAQLAAQLRGWRHHRFVHDYRKYKLDYLREANFEPPSDMEHVIELDYVEPPEGVPFLKLSEVRPLSSAEFFLARLTTFGMDKMDERKIYPTKIVSKPWFDFPRSHMRGP